MLILTRRLGEQVIINDEIITILSMKGNQIRIGINAPREASVQRKEIYERIQMTKKLKDDAFLTSSIKQKDFL